MAFISYHLFLFFVSNGSPIAFHPILFPSAPLVGLQCALQQRVLDRAPLRQLIIVAIVVMVNVREKLIATHVVLRSNAAVSAPARSGGARARNLDDNNIGSRRIVARLCIENGGIDHPLAVVVGRRRQFCAELGANDDLSPKMQRDTSPKHCNQSKSKITTITTNHQKSNRRKRNARKLTRSIGDLQSGQVARRSG
jgi:hypothetical protein